MRPRALPPAASPRRAPSVAAGNYDDFKTMHEQKVAKQEKDYEKQQKLVAAMKGALGWHLLSAVIVARCVPDAVGPLRLSP